MRDGVVRSRSRLFAFRDGSQVRCCVSSSDSAIRATACASTSGAGQTRRLRSIAVLTGTVAWGSRCRRQMWSWSRSCWRTSLRSGRCCCMWLKHRHICARSHFFAAHVPVDAFDCTPRQAHFFCNHLPHLLLEPGRMISLWIKRLGYCSPLTDCRVWPACSSSPRPNPDASRCSFGSATDS